MKWHAWCSTNCNSCISLWLWFWITAGNIGASTVDLGESFLPRLGDHYYPMSCIMAGWSVPGIYRFFSFFLHLVCKYCWLYQKKHDTFSKWVSLSISPPPFPEWHIFVNDPQVHIIVIIFLFLEQWQKSSPCLYHLPRHVIFLLSASLSSPPPMGRTERQWQDNNPRGNDDVNNEPNLSSLTP